MAARNEGITTVPVRQRWQWARLQAKADAEGGFPPEAWDDHPPRHLTAIAYWAYMLRWPPLTNGHAVIVSSRTRFGRAATIFGVIVAIAIIVGIARRLPWLGIPLGILAFPIGVGSLAHTIGTWRIPGPTTFLANFIRRPESPKGSGLPLFQTVCDRADLEHRTLALHTRRARLIDLYAAYGFEVIDGPNHMGRVRMIRPPNRDQGQTHNTS